MVTVYAMRRPSGDSSTLPTARKRERSLLAKPCAAPELANINSATAQQRLKPARCNTDCQYRRIGLSLNSQWAQEFRGHPRPRYVHGQLLFLGGQSPAR